MTDALRIATRPHDLQLLIDARGHTATTMEDLDRFNPEGAAPAV